MTEDTNTNLLAGAEINKEQSTASHFFTQWEASHDQNIRQKNMINVMEKLLQHWMLLLHLLLFLIVQTRMSFESPN